MLLLFRGDIGMEFGWEELFFRGVCRACITDLFIITYRNFRFFFLRTFLKISFNGLVWF